MSTAISGTASSAPVIPAMTTPAATARAIASGCNRTARPISTGCSTWLSSCCTASTTPSTTSAVPIPFATSAMSTAIPPPVSTAPTIGTNAPTNTSAVNGRASGTPVIHSLSPIPIASTIATRTVARTYPTSDAKARRPATSTRSRRRAGARSRRNDQRREPSYSMKISANRQRANPASTSPTVAAVLTAPDVRVCWLSCRVCSSWVPSCSTFTSNGVASTRPCSDATLMVSCPIRSDVPSTSVLTTAVSSPPSAASPPTITSPVARERGTRWSCSHCTSGASSAASSTALATEMTTTRSWTATKISSARPAAITSIRAHTSEAIRSGGGDLGAGRGPAEALRDVLVAGRFGGRPAGGHGTVGTARRVPVHLGAVRLRCRLRGRSRVRRRRGGRG